MSYDRATGIIADELRSSRTTDIATLVARYGLVIVLAWFGAMKFTSYEAQGSSHWVANSPLLGWTYNVMSIDAFGPSRNLGERAHAFDQMMMLGVYTFGVYAADDAMWQAITGNPMA